MKAIAVIDRDLRKFRRNPVIIAMSVIMPIVYLIILGNSFQGKIKGIPLAVVNYDSGQYARRLMENLRAVEAGPRTFFIVNLNDQKAAVDGVREGRYKGALIIPPDFSKRIILTTRPEVGLFTDNTDAISSGALNEAVSGALREIKSGYTPIRENPSEVYLRGEDLYRKVDYDQSLVPGVVIMAIFMGTMITGVFNLVMDRFLGVDESYLLTPLTKGDIVTGLVVSGLFITTLLALMVFVLGVLITGIPLSGGIGQCGAIFMVIVLTTLGLLSMMFIFLGRANHPRMVGIFSGFMNVILFFPSGAVYPIASFPGWLKTFARINPEAYAVDALKALIFKGVRFHAIIGDIAFLTLFTLITMTIAIMTFKRTL